MCLAVYCPAGKIVPVDYLREAFKNNPHGAGFSYIDEKFKIRRERFMKFDDFLVAYEDAKKQYGDSSPFSIHFRYATHGKTDIDNVHPFMYGNDTSVIHNGIIDCLIPKKRMSDTASFVENYLANLPHEWYDDPYLFDMVEQYCAGSKLVVLTTNPNAKYSAYIVNERSGHWLDDVWYSNGSYCKTKPFMKDIRISNDTVYEESHLFYDMEMQNYGFGKCELCDEVAVDEGVCYYCETCQECMQEIDYCHCVAQVKKDIHRMTDHEFMESDTPV